LRAGGYRMAKAQTNPIEDSRTCRLQAECIKISGRSHVFSAESVTYEKNQLSMVSKTAVPPGTCLIVRMLDLPGIKHCRDVGAPRTVGIAEVQGVEEVMDDGGMAYKLLAKYLYTE